MCRLMGYVSPREMTVSAIAGEDFDQFSALSAKHGDGWGYAKVNSAADRSLTVEVARAKESEKYLELTKNLQSTGGLLHLRWATLNLAVTEGNTHPFTHGDFSFIHNGSIKPPESLDRFIDVKYLEKLRGATDSERYFYLLLSFIDQLGIHEGIHQGVKTITEHCDFSSLNAMIMTPDLYITISEHNYSRIPEGEGPEYYDLFYRKDADGVLVASSGWNQPGWQQIPNHHYLEVDRTNFETKLTKF
jgi:predicted glutamine amidotransferase